VNTYKSVGIMRRLTLGEALSDDFLSQVAGFHAGSVLGGYRLEALVGRAGWRWSSGPAMSALAGRSR